MSYLIVLIMFTVFLFKWIHLPINQSTFSWPVLMWLCHQMIRTFIFQERITLCSPLDKNTALALSSSGFVILFLSPSIEQMMDGSSQDLFTGWSVKKTSQTIQVHVHKINLWVKHHANETMTFKYYLCCSLFNFCTILTHNVPVMFLYIVWYDTILIKKYVIY